MKPVLAIGATLLVLAAGAADQKLEFRGTIEPAPKKYASVQLHGQDFPFEASTLSDLKGRFKFKKIDPGQYAVIIFVPGQGTSRRTVDLHAGRADEKGRITITVPYEPSGESLEAATTVSVGELAIPKKAQREFGKAQKQLNKRDVEAAIAHLERAVELAPNFVGAWNNLGTIAYQSRRYRDAEKYFRTALRYEPGAYSPVVNLGGTLLSLSQYKEALKYNEYAVQMRPAEALPNSQLGMNFHYLGDDDSALKYLTEARRIDPNHFSHPQLLLARIYLSRGESKQAARELNDFLDRHPNSPSAEAAKRWLNLIHQ
jgi:Tfp pilus assembly protein PilF